MQILVNPAATAVDANALRETAVDALGMQGAQKATRKNGYCRNENDDGNDGEENNGDEYDNGDQIIMTMMMKTTMSMTMMTMMRRICLLYTSPSPRDAHESRMPSSA